MRANKRGSVPAPDIGRPDEDAVVTRVVAVDRGRYTCVVDEDGPEPVTALCVRQGAAPPSHRAGDLVGVVGHAPARRHPCPDRADRAPRHGAATQRGRHRSAER
ncbi:hypothetical protein QJS66_23100 [Kocuria rhizophila]|nr:hypothetical protein QJS66_23100 [Kocuria rhizophila]